MSSDVKRFYKDRAQSIKTDWKRFDYDEEGNMVERTKNENGQYTVIKTIARPVYRPLTYEERDIMERERQEAIAAATRVFETARRALYDASRVTSSASFKNEITLLSLNRAVQEAEYALSRARFPLYTTIREDKVEIRTMDPSQPAETRKFPYPIMMAKTFPFSLQPYYVREGEAVVPFQSVAEIQQQLSQKQPISEPVILFSTPDTNEYGFLSLEWASDLEFQQTMYHSAIQAVYGELAKVLGDEKNRQKIMLADSSFEIHYTINDVPESASLWKENLARLLYEVNLHKFTRYPELQKMLLQTGTAVLGAYLPNDVLLGIGISPDRKESKQPSHWTGENLLGKALMEVRQVLRTSPVSSSQARAKVSTEPKGRRMISRPKRPVNHPLPAEAIALPAEAVAVPVEATAVPAEAVAVPAEAVAVPAEATVVPVVSARRVIRRPVHVK